MITDKTALKYAKELKTIALRMKDYCHGGHGYDCDKCGYQRLCLDMLPEKFVYYLDAIIKDLEAEK